MSVLSTLIYRFSAITTTGSDSVDIDKGISNSHREAGDQTANTVLKGSKSGADITSLYVFHILNCYLFLMDDCKGLYYIYDVALPPSSK